MGLSTMTQSARRAWTVEVRPQRDRTAVVCRQCGPLQAASASMRQVAITHLAQHARDETLAAHLRICQCREHGCRWHARHRGCDGPVLLILTRCSAGRLWRLADTCRACALTTEHGAVVRDAEEPRGPAVLGPGRGCAAHEDQEPSMFFGWADGGEWFPWPGPDQLRDGGGVVSESYRDEGWSTLR